MVGNGSGTYTVPFGKAGLIAARIPGPVGLFANTEIFFKAAPPKAFRGVKRATASRQR
jgi:hypothetical protein